MKMDFFVSEVDFENLLEVIGITYVFDIGQKCHFLWMSVFFVFRPSCAEKCLKKIWPEFKICKIGSPEESENCQFSQ